MTSHGKLVPSHHLHSHSKVQVKLHHLSLLYIYNHSLLENPGANVSLVIAKSILRPFSASTCLDHYNSLNSQIV